jgi:hypothetical protein
MITKVKGCMWAVGNVGSMELGAPFLESCGVVEQIVKIAQGHEIMSLRGTAFFVLGLISRSAHGLEILSEHGWDSNTNMLGTSLGFCIPTDLSKLFSLRPWEHEMPSSIQLPVTQMTEAENLPAMPSRPRSESLRQAIEAEHGPEAAKVRKVRLDPDETNQRILELVIDVANAVLQRRAMYELVQIKRQKRPDGFRQPQLFRRVMALMERNHYRLDIRRDIVKLFDKNMLRQIVFDEESGDEGREVKRNVVPAAVRAEKSKDSNSKTDDHDDGDGGDDDDDDSEKEEDSSGDDQRTERQRSISDPRDL